MTSERRDLEKESNKWPAKGSNDAQGKVFLIKKIGKYYFLGIFSS